MILPFIYNDGEQEWYENGWRPSYKRSDIKVGKLHRVSGPAGISGKGTQHYYYNGQIQGIFYHDNQPQTFHTRKHHPTEGTVL